MKEAQLLVDAHALIGEGPWWDSRESLLYWIDINGKLLHIFDPSASTGGAPVGGGEGVRGADRAIALSGRPGAIVGRKGGGLLAAMDSGLCFLDPASGEERFVCDPEADLPGNRFNDGKCDPQGRFWVGSMDDAEKDRTGSFYRLDAGLGCERAFGEVGISNGLAWSLDGRKLYYIDTPTGRVDAFDFELETGELSNRRLAFEVPHDMGFPDGMTIDEEGMLWVALWAGWSVGRWDPRTGKLLEALRLPVAKVSSCAFGAREPGGPLDRLYVTTASKELSPEEKSAQPQAGGLFAFDPGVRGLPSVPFAG
jgi:Gluconolactonase